MRVQKIKIRNIGNISSLEKEINGHNLIAIGKNGVGKSSVIDTLFEVLQGKYSKPNSVKKGERGGEYEIDLGEWIADFTFKPEEKTASLKLTTKQGQIINAAKTTLSGVVGILDFDIDEFLTMSDSEKVKYLFKHVDLGMTPEQLAQIELDRQTLYEERTIVNRDVDLAKKTLSPPDEVEKKLAQKEPIKIQELYKKKSEIEKTNQKIEYVENGLNEKNTRISEIEKQIEALKAEQKQLNEDVKKGKEYLSKHQKQDPSEIDTKIQQAENENEQIREAKEAVEKFNSLKENLDEDLKSQEDLNKRISEIDDMKKNLIIDGLEIPGLDYDAYADRFIFGDKKLSLNELNEAQKYIIGIRVGAKQLKNLRIMRFQANGLDNDSLKKILEFGKENNIQFFIEMMDRNTEELQIKVDEEL